MITVLEYYLGELNDALGDLCDGSSLDVEGVTVDMDDMRIGTNLVYKLSLHTTKPMSLIKQIVDSCGTARIKRVIQNGPATVVLFDDGTKQVAKAHEGDRFDPKFGTIWCALRKAARNRTIDHLEKAVKAVAWHAKGPDDYEALGNALLMVAEHMKGDE